MCDEDFICTGSGLYEQGHFENITEAIEFFLSLELSPPKNEIKTITIQGNNSEIIKIGK